MMIDPNTTLVGEAVAHDYRTAGVFQKHGIDFCCGGGQTIVDSCAKKGVNVDAVVAELEQTLTTPSNGAPRFNAWDLDLLVDFIITNHHQYVRESMPTILEHVRKVARVHGERHPETLVVAETFEAVADELAHHMQKEELVLFPYIKAMVAARRMAEGGPRAPFGAVGNPIAMMEHEHETVGSALAHINTLTDGFTAPADACTTFRVTYQELRAFENDLHQHVHLENNILFPKAIALERELQTVAACTIP
jgi:regulator of cell morphogenesis and NO signaling